MPHTATSATRVTVDGRISEGEYAGQLTESTTGINLYWEQNGTDMRVGLTSPGTGWVAIGFNARGGGMDKGNIIIAAVAASSTLAISDEVGVGFNHYSDLTQGGTNDVKSSAGTESGGKTTIEFIYPLSSGDKNDQSFGVGGTYAVFLAYHASEDGFTVYHTAHSKSLDVFVEPEGAPEPKETVVLVSPLSPAKVHEPIKVVVNLRDSDSKPVSGGVINLYINTTFGYLNIGSNSTDPDGNTTFSITPTKNGILTLRAVHIGNPLYHPSNVTVDLQVEGSIVYTPGYQGQDYTWTFTTFIIGLGALFASVFGTYIFVLSGLYRIRRHGYHPWPGFIGSSSFEAKAEEK